MSKVGHFSQSNTFVIFVMPFVVLFVVLLALLLMLPISAKTFTSPSQIATTKTTGASLRILQFPDHQSLGPISIGNEHSVFGPIHSYKRIATASGTVKIVVPAGQRVYFEANRRVFQDPSILEKISPEGIEAIKLSSISLDDREDDMCDRALGYLKHFRTLSEVSIDRSDATDSGAAKLAAVPSIVLIDCFLSEVHGACFAELCKLPTLKTLLLSKCALDQKYMRYLAQCQKLQELDIGHTSLSEEGSRSLGQCANLQTLIVSGNPRFNDKCLQHLNGLTRLTYLDTKATAVTLEGFKHLQLPSLNTLCVPFTLISDVKVLKKLFPKASISVEHLPQSPSSDDNQIYAPLH